MKKDLILGIRNEKGEIFLYDFKGYKNDSSLMKQKVEIGKEITADVIKVFPYTTPSTLYELPKGYKYLVLEAEIELTDNEKENLSHSSIRKFEFYNRKVIVQKVCDKPILSLTKDLLQKCFYNMYVWWTHMPMAEEEITIILKEYERRLKTNDKHYYFNPSINLNFLNVHNLKRIISFVNNWEDKKMIQYPKISIESMGYEYSIRKDNIGSFIKKVTKQNLSTREKAFILNNLLCSRDDSFIYKELLLKLLDNSLSEYLLKDSNRFYFFLKENPNILSLKNIDVDLLLSNAKESNLINFDEEEFKCFLKEEAIINDRRDSFIDDDYDYDDDYDDYDDYYYDDYDDDYNPYNDFFSEIELIKTLYPYLTSKSKDIINSIPQNIKRFYEIEDI